MKAPQDIILRPIITERSIDMLPSGKYTFKVAKDANKVEIAKAVEQLFSVEVTKVNTMNCKGRAKREPDDKKTKSSIEFFDGLY